MPAVADLSGWRTAVTTRGALTYLLADAAIEVRDAGERVAADTARLVRRPVAVGRPGEAPREPPRGRAAEDERTEQHALDEVAARTGAGGGARSGTTEGTRA